MLHNILSSLHLNIYYIAQWTKHRAGKQVWSSLMIYDRYLKCNSMREKFAMRRVLVFNFATRKSYYYNSFRKNLEYLLRYYTFSLLNIINRFERFSNFHTMMMMKLFTTKMNGYKATQFDKLRPGKYTNSLHSLHLISAWYFITTMNISIFNYTYETSNLNYVKIYKLTVYFTWEHQRNRENPLVL